MLTDELTEEIAAAGNKYRWHGHHRRASPTGRSLRRGFFAGTAAGTGMVIAAIAFPLNASEGSGGHPLFVDPSPSLSEPEAEHADVDPLGSCLVCVDPPIRPLPLDEPTESTQARPADPTPIHTEPVVAKHRRVEPVVIPPLPGEKPPPAPEQPPAPPPVEEQPPAPPPVEEEPPCPEPTDTVEPEPTPDPTDGTAPPPVPTPEPETTEEQEHDGDATASDTRSGPDLRALRQHDAVG